MATKIAYRTFTVEAEFNVPRLQVWDAVAGVAAAPDHEGREGAFREEVLSLEPPWRRVSVLHGGPLPLHQMTVTIRDDGAGCLLAYSGLFHPGDDNDVTDAFVDACHKAAERQANEWRSALNL